MQIVINSAFLIGVIGSVLIVFYKYFKMLKTTPKKLFFVTVTLLHFVASVVFFLSLDKLPENDATNFYVNALYANSWLSLCNFGSSFISFLIYPFVKLGITLPVLFAFFAAISYTAFIQYFKLLSFQKSTNKINWFLLFFIVPSVHFWTGFVGKEALLLVFMVQILKGITHKKYDNWFWFQCILVFLIRPHVFFVLVVSLLIVLSTDTTITAKYKKKLMVYAMLFMLICLPLSALYFLKIDGLDFTAIKNYYDSFLNYTINKGNTAISLTNTTILSRTWYLLYMPLPVFFEIKNLFQMVVSVEGVYFLISFMYFIYISFQKQICFKRLDNGLKFALLSSLLLIVLFASYLYNLGLGNRMRMMFYPYLFYFFITIVNLKNEKKIN